METDSRISFDDTRIAFNHKSDRQLWKAHLIFSIVNTPWLSVVAQQVAALIMLLRGPFTNLLRYTVYEHFCGGEDVATVDKTIERMSQRGVSVILHCGVEGQDSEEGYEKTADETIKSIVQAARHPNVPFCVLKTTGIASHGQLEYVQSGQPLGDEEREALDRVRSRFERICNEARAHGIALLVDAEETWVQTTIDSLAWEMIEKYNKSKAVVFITYQFYCTDALARLQQGVERAISIGVKLGVKLVRGAYMEQERARAARFGYPDPIQPDKASSDHAFDDALRFCMEHLDVISLVCGSHNEASNHLLADMLKERGVSADDQRVWFSQLLGMSDHISFNLAAAGHNVAKYIPYGPVRFVIPYLIRRARENTSVAKQMSRELALVKKEIRRRRAERSAANPMNKV